MTSSGIVQAALAAAVLAALSGCSGTTNVSDELTTSALAKTNKSVAIMRMGVAGETCPAALLTLATKAGDEFAPAKTVRMSNQSNAPSDVAQIELDPGEYHVVSWTCTVQVGNTRNVTTLGKRSGGLLSGGGTYKQSFGSFELTSGEIVNLGSIRLVDVGLNNVLVDVTDLPADAREKFARDKPNLARQMTTRLFKVNRPPMTLAQRKALCEIWQVRVKYGQDNRPPPPECAELLGGPGPSVANRSVAKR